jgi:nicotinate-nucleotide pyrophosphorylase (carboxylating)
MKDSANMPAMHSEGLARRLEPVPDLVLEPLVRAALAEDLGRVGDLTTQSVVPRDSQARVRLAARAEGILAGLDAARMAFRLVNTELMIAVHKRDGDMLSAGDIIAHIQGPARALLTAERVALNFLGHMSGIATLTGAYVNAVSHTKARIVCTRKTLPGLRIVQKYAVRAGGGVNHRFGLDDGILIKDNHIAVTGSITAAVRMARTYAGHMLKIEVEVETQEQMKEAVDAGAEALLLDNMAPSELRKAVAYVNGRAITEASGGVNLATVATVAETGVDLISVGALTHSAPNLDIALDFDAIV